VKPSVCDITENSPEFFHCKVTKRGAKKQIYPIISAFHCFCGVLRATKRRSVLSDAARGNHCSIMTLQLQVHDVAIAWS
jgi:hypothetical protein